MVGYLGQRLTFQPCWVGQSAMKPHFLDSAALHHSSPIWPYVSVAASTSFKLSQRMRAIILNPIFSHVFHGKLRRSHYDSQIQCDRNVVQLLHLTSSCSNLWRILAQFPLPRCLIESLPTMISGVSKEQLWVKETKKFSGERKPEQARAHHTTKVGG